MKVNIIKFISTVLLLLFAQSLYAETPAIDIVEAATLARETLKKSNFSNSHFITMIRYHPAESDEAAVYKAYLQPTDSKPDEKLNVIVIGMDKSCKMIEEKEVPLRIRRKRITLPSSGEKGATSNSAETETDH